VRGPWRKTREEEEKEEEKKKNQKKRDAEIPTAPSKEKSSRNRRTVVECMRAMCFPCLECGSDWL